MSGTKELGSLIAQIGADMRQWEESMRQVEKSMQGAEKAAQTSTQRMNERFERTGKKMKSIGKNISMYLTLPIMGFGTLALKTAGNFEQSMNRVGAISQATGKDMEALEKQARDLGATTQFSASEAADAMGFLAMAGFEVNQVMGAMPATLNLAAAGQMDLARSADIVSNIMGGFGMVASETDGVVDVLAKTFTSANTNLEELGEAMSYAAPVSKAYGHSVEETAAAIGFLSDAGIKASRAGTSVRQMLLQLSEKAEQLGLNVFDTQGKMLGMVELLEEIENSGISTEKVIEELGARAGPGTAVLLEKGSAAMREYIQELENAGGTAERVAEQQMQGLNGALKELRSAFEELLLVITGSGLLDWTTKMVKRMTEWTRELSKLDPEILKWGVRLAGVTAAAGPLLLVIGKIVSLIPTLVAGLVSLKTVALGPLGIVIGGVTAIWKLWNSQILKTKELTADVADKTLEELAQQARDTGNELGELLKRREELTEAAEKAGTRATGPGTATQGLYAAQIDDLNVIIAKREKEMQIVTDQIAALQEKRKTEQDITTENEKQIKLLTDQNVIPTAEPAIVREDIPEKLETISSGLLNIGESSKIGLAPMRSLMKGAVNAGNTLNDTLSVIGNTISDTANAFTSLGNAIQSASEDGKVSFVEAMNIISQAAMTAIGVLGALASAKLISAEASKGAIGLITAVAGLATLAGMFASFTKPAKYKPQGLMYGGDVQKSGIFEVGEAGRENVFLPKGAAVRPPSSGIEGQSLKFVIEDDTLVALLNWNERKQISFG